MGKCANYLHWILANVTNEQNLRYRFWDRHSGKRRVYSFKKVLQSEIHFLGKVSKHILRLRIADCFFDFAKDFLRNRRKIEGDKVAFQSGVPAPPISKCKLSGSNRIPYLLSVIAEIVAFRG